ncbi:hypothetical protein TI05_17515, partial [Achromatium sp. WMS3]
MQKYQIKIRTIILNKLMAFRKSSTYRNIGNRGRICLDALIPKLLETIVTDQLSDLVSDPDTLLERLLKLLETIARRTAYLSLLTENPGVLAQLVKLTAASSWVAERITRYPILLDELIDPRRLYVPLRHQDLLEELLSFLQAVDDEEQYMERLRQFAHSNRLRTAAADITKKIPVMKVSDYLTDLAEVILSSVLEQCWNYLTERHGSPSGIKGKDTGFAIIGYGKLGGIELGYGSDLDLVFLHDNQDRYGQTTGQKPIANDVFYTRLAQRIIHTLNTRTPSGILYEIDTRLRPNGNAG